MIKCSEGRLFRVEKVGASSLERPLFANCCLCIAAPPSVRFPPLVWRVSSPTRTTRTSRSSAWSMLRYNSPDWPFVHCAAFQEIDTDRLGTLEGFKWRRSRNRKKATNKPMRHPHNSLSSSYPLCQLNEAARAILASSDART